MRSQATIEVWSALAETAALLRHLDEIPPPERVTVARKCVLRSCLAIRKYFDDNPESLHELLKDAQRTLLHLRKFREAERRTTIH
jgi:hypothetical protein